MQKKTTAKNQSQNRRRNRDLDRILGKTTRQRVDAARKGKAARLKGVKARVAGDIEAAHGELPQWTTAEVAEAFRRFQAANPVPRGELQHINPFTLLIAVVLSAQATDVSVNKATAALYAQSITISPSYTTVAGVNKATPALFKLADTPE